MEKEVKARRAATLQGASGVSPNSAPGWGLAGVRRRGRQSRQKTSLWHQRSRKRGPAEQSSGCPWQALETSVAQQLGPDAPAAADTRASSGAAAGPGEVTP